MYDLVSIDPGSRVSGLAYWYKGLLIGIHEIKSASLVELNKRVQDFRGAYSPTVVVEWPVVYEHGKADPNDLILVAIAAGMLATLGGHAEFVKPSDWKGKVPKPKRKSEPYIIERRNRQALNSDELKAYGDKPGWDVSDAVGIGLWFLKRKKVA